MTVPTDDAIDAAILARATSEWVKVAVLIAAATDEIRLRGTDAVPGAIAARIYALAESGALEVQGNVRRWRAAVVRLKG